MASWPSKRHLKNHLACELCVLKAWTCLHPSLFLPCRSQGCVPNFPKRKSPSQLNLYMGERVNIHFLTREEGLRTPVIERLREVGSPTLANIVAWSGMWHECLWRWIKSILDYYYSLQSVQYCNTTKKILWLIFTSIWETSYNLG